MEWIKHKDGERVSTPIFVGFTSMPGVEKSNQLLACEHQWEQFGLTETKGEVELSTDRCSVCEGTRVRLVGPEAHLLRTVVVHAKDRSDSESDDACESGD